MLQPANLFHVGIRVADLGAAMEEVGAACGVTWASVQDAPMSIWLPDDGHVTLPVAITYSIEGPVHIELIEGPAGSIWDGRDEPGLHHSGYWSDDVGADTAALLAAGWTLEMSAAAPEDGYGRFAYLRSSSGVRVEPVTATSKPRFERWWAGGALRDPVS